MIGSPPVRAEQEAAIAAGNGAASSLSVIALAAEVPSGLELCFRNSLAVSLGSTCRKRCCRASE
jgi:hypothetical protein